MNGIIQIKYSTIPRSNPKYTRYHHKAYILSLKQQNKKKNKMTEAKGFQNRIRCVCETRMPPSQSLT